MRIRSVWSLTLLGAMAAGGSAQIATPAPEFEVASVRPSEPLDQGKVMAMVQAGKRPRFGEQVEGLSAEYLRMQLKQLIAKAYGVRDYQVKVPKDISSDAFDIVARMPEGSTKDDAPKMLRTLLEQRFKLEAKKVTQEEPVYALVLAKGGPKLKESATKPAPLDLKAELKPNQTRQDGPFGPMVMTRGTDNSATLDMGEKGKYVERIDMQSRIVRLEGTGLTMQGFAEMMSLISIGLANSAGKPIVDMTDLKGYYDISVELSLNALMQQPGGAGAGGTEATVPSGGLGLEESVQKVGLKLEQRRASVEQVIVTHVEKMPTEN